MIVSCRIVCRTKASKGEKVGQVSVEVSGGEFGLSQQIFSFQVMRGKKNVQQMLFLMHPCRVIGRDQSWRVVQIGMKARTFYKGADYIWYIHLGDEISQCCAHSTFSRTRIINHFSISCLNPPGSVCDGSVARKRSESWRNNSDNHWPKPFDRPSFWPLRHCGSSAL